MSKNWVGNYNSIYKTLGASNHTDDEREENDFYATDPKALEMLLEKEEFNKYIFEPACGQGHLSEILKKHGYNVRSSDLIDRGYGQGGMDFLEYDKPIDKDIITNVPYSIGAEFVMHAMDLLTEGHKAAFFLKLTFYEGETRRALFDKYPPKVVYVSTRRIDCAKNGEFKLDKDGKQVHSGGAVCYAWFVFEKGFHGDTILRRFN